MVKSIPRIRRKINVSLISKCPVFKKSENGCSENSECQLQILCSTNFKEEVSKVEESLHKTIHEHDGEHQFLSRIPHEAMQADDLIKLVEEYSQLG